jgi:hypothetical protein
MSNILVPEYNRLNLGCGFNKLDDHWNVDQFEGCTPDQIVDLEVFPWPWEDNFFSHIHASNILEHLGQDPKVFTKIMKELYRVSCDGAEWFIQIPHHRSDTYSDDYTHVRTLTEKTFKMFDQNVNTESISKGASDSTYGLYHNIDIETFKVNYNIVDYWKNQQEQGMIGYRELNSKMNFNTNVIQSVDIHVRVHKPGRFTTIKKK